MLLPMLILPDHIRQMRVNTQARDQAVNSQHQHPGLQVFVSVSVAPLMNYGHPNQAVCLYTVLLLAQVSGSHDKKLTFSHFCGFYRV